MKPVLSIATLLGLLAGAPPAHADLHQRLAAPRSSANFASLIGRERHVTPVERARLQGVAVAHAARSVVGRAVGAAGRAAGSTALTRHGEAITARANARIVSRTRRGLHGVRTTETFRRDGLRLEPVSTKVSVLTACHRDDGTFAQTAGTLQAMHADRHDPDAYHRGRLTAVERLDHPRGGSIGAGRVTAVEDHLSGRWTQTTRWADGQHAVAVYNRRNGLPVTRQRYDTDGRLRYQEDIIYHGQLPRGATPGRPESQFRFDDSHPYLARIRRWDARGNLVQDLDPPTMDQGGPIPLVTAGGAARARANREYWHALRDRASPL